MIRLGCVIFMRITKVTVSEVDGGWKLVRWCRTTIMSVSDEVYDDEETAQRHADHETEHHKKYRKEVWEFSGMVK